MNDELLNLNQTKPSKQQAYAAWIFGGLLIIFYMFVFLFFPSEMPDGRQKMLALISAFLGGFFTFFFTGSITVNLKWSWLGKIFVQAGGGIASFVFIIWWWTVSSFAPINTTPLFNESELNVFEYKKNILLLLNHYYSIDEQDKHKDNPAWQKVSNQIRVEAPSYSELLMKIRDENLATRYALEKYEYLAYGYILAATVEKNSEEVLSHADNLIKSCLKALEIIDYALNDENEDMDYKIYIKKYEKTDKFHYMLAIAYAIKARKGEVNSIKEFKKEWKKVNAQYREHTPPRHKDLIWALNETLEGE